MTTAILPPLVLLCLLVEFFRLPTLEAIDPMFWLVGDRLTLPVDRSVGRRQVYFFLELTTIDSYVCSLYAPIRIRTPAFLLFLKPIFIIGMASLVVNPTNAASRCDHSPTVILSPIIFNA